MIILGVVLLLCGYFFHIQLLWIIGLILLIVGVVILLIDLVGGTRVGGHRWY